MRPVKFFMRSIFIFAVAALLFLWGCPKKEGSPKAEGPAAGEKVEAPVEKKAPVEGKPPEAAVKEKIPEDKAEIVVKFTEKSTMPSPRLSHRRHAEEYAVACRECHHTEGADRACRSCHKAKIGAQGESIFKDAMHKKCVNCHMAKGAGPTVCVECHKE